jgi:hypothetical protein
MSDATPKIEIPAAIPEEARGAWEKLRSSEPIKLRTDPAWIKSENEARERMAKFVHGKGKEPGPALKAIETYILSAAGYVELEAGKMQDAADLANRHQRMATLALLLHSILANILHKAQVASEVSDTAAGLGSAYLHGEVGRSLFPVLWELGIMPKPEQDEVSH